ncbi:MAG: sigma-E processing peptidase SpoIIGA [Syntrophomonas sp.]
MGGPTVYADLSFLINYIMDFLILWASARLAGIKVVFKRIALASFLGALYAVGFLYSSLENWYSLPLKILFSCLMLILALWPQNWNELKKAFLYFYAVNFIVAGASIATSYIFNTSPWEMSFSKFFLLGGIVCTLAIGILGEKFLFKRLLPPLLKFNVELHFDDRCCKGSGFLDTGNNLRDPLTNRPVLVAEYQSLKNCLPDEFITALETGGNESEMLESLRSSCWASRLRLIPFTSIGRKNGILVGVRADEIILNAGNRDIFHKNLVVGIYRDVLSSRGDYQFLIPAEIMEKG